MGCWICERFPLVQFPRLATANLSGNKLRALSYFKGPEVETVDDKKVGCSKSGYYLRILRNLLLVESNRERCHSQNSRRHSMAYCHVVSDLDSATDTRAVSLLTTSLATGKYLAIKTFLAGE